MRGAQPRQALPDHAGDHLPAQDRRRARRGRRELRRAPRRDAGHRRRDGMRQEHHRAADHAAARRHIGRSALRRAGHHAAEGSAAEGDAARDADDLPGPLLVAEPAQDRGLHHRRAVRDPRARARQGDAQEGGHRPDGHRRVEPRALQPLPARVLGRPAPAHRRRAGTGAEAEAADRRRARVGARRLDPGAGAQPAARPAAEPRAHAHLHRARSVCGAAHVRPRRSHVSRQGGRDRRRRRALRHGRVTPTPGRCCRPSPSPTRACRRSEEPPLRGYMPSPANPPSACRFRTRCPKARALCAEQEPPLEDKGTGTLAACHFPLTEQEKEQIGVRSPR